MVHPKQNADDKSPYFWAVARIFLGLTFMWAFFDKLFGLGFATCRDVKTEAVSMFCEKAWVSGGSPTTGFLKFAAKGPLESFYHNLAGNMFIDVLFMAGLFLIGFALVFGIGMKLASVSGVLLMAMMWSALLLPENNPVIDEHVIYSVVLLGLLAANHQQKLGLRHWWVKQSLVKRFPVLE